MRKALIKIIVLIAVFCTTVLVAGFVTHKNNVDLTSEMKSTTLPVIYLQEEETQVNQLFGYTKEMDGTAMRDTITPLNETRKLPVTIKAYETQVDEISYQVRTLDMDRLVEEEKISDFTQKNGEIKLNLQFENILEIGTEYMLIIKINETDAPIYFYTRIICDKKYYVKEAVDFVMKFHELTFDKENAGELATYLEPNSSGDNSTLQKVTINSSLSQVTWGEFKGKRMEKPVPSIKEIGSNYNTIVLNYVMTGVGENNEVEYYNVEEYYRVRYSSSSDRNYLLNYERTMNQLFRGENEIIKEGNIGLGIRSKDVEYKTNEKGSVIAFVQEGELWSYNGNNNQLSRVYSFLEAEGMKERENNLKHQIKIIKIDENGSMNFVVYGYMNRGKHEGETGIGVFHYDSVGNTIEEELFIPSNKSYEMLKTEWGKIFYVSDANVFYILAEDILYRIDLYTRETKKVATGLWEGSYGVSANGRYIAWQDSDDMYHSKKLIVMDLEGEETSSITAEEGEYLKPIGFVESDFVYGIARESDITVDGAGNTQFPMYRVAIVDHTSQVIEDYQKEGYYISSAYVEKERIFLNRIYREGDNEIEAEQDTIKNQQIESARIMSIETFQTQEKQRQIQFTFVKPITTSKQSPQVVVPKEIVVKEKRRVKLDAEEEQELYYVYSGGKILRSTPVASEAIEYADANLGAVIGETQEYIWRSGREDNQPIVGDVTVNTSIVSDNSRARCLAAMLQVEGISMDVDGLLNQGKTPKEILTEALTERKVIDLTGCNVEQILYYVNQKTPVLAIVDQEALLVVGYDKHNTILYNPQTNNTYKLGIQDSTQLFNQGGNVFLGYIE
ncbi:MAG: hypothetical protein RR139_10975 [Lachnospiraceae bacterium]